MPASAAAAKAGDAAGGAPVALKLPLHTLLPAASPAKAAPRCRQQQRGGGARGAGTAARRSLSTAVAKSPALSGTLRRPEQPAAKSSPAARKRSASNPSRLFSQTLPAKLSDDNGDIADVQATIAAYRYNMNGATYDVSKDRPLVDMLDTAAEILLRPCEPIQCVEAALVALRLTQGVSDVTRFGISFHSKKWRPGCGPLPDVAGAAMTGSPAKSLMARARNRLNPGQRDACGALEPRSPTTVGSEGKAGEKDKDKAAADKSAQPPKEKEYDIINHLVIGLYRAGRFGAVGISRHPGLHNKPMTFLSLADLVWDFAQHYREDRQQLLSVRLGDGIPHAVAGDHRPVWRRTEIRLTHWNIAEQRLRQFQEQLVAQPARSKPPAG
ncbi:hypothetical protein DIPPA_29937 [Diplonema papillatum]|nr:hypothetical protein DIPPA_29937 [Diplonema papillatum]